MFLIRPLPQFTAWIDGLKDETVRGVIVARIKRLQLGLMGDVQQVGDGISELRIHLGAGWRLYFTQRGPQLCCWSVGRNAPKTKTSTEPKHWPLYSIERRKRS